MERNPNAIIHDCRPSSTSDSENEKSENSLSGDEIQHQGKPIPMHDLQEPSWSGSKTKNIPDTGMGRNIPDAGIGKNIPITGITGNGDCTVRRFISNRDRQRTRRSRRAKGVETGIIYDFTDERFGPEKDEDGNRILVMSRTRDIRKMLSGRALYTRNTIIPITANGLPVMAFIDSGASISVITPRLAKYMVDYCGGVMIPCKDQIEVFEGGKVILTNKIEINLMGRHEGGKYLVYVSQTNSLGFDVCLGDDICDISDMVINWSRKAVRMFGEVTPRMTRTMINAKKDQLDEMFETQVFRKPGGRTTSP